MAPQPSIFPFKVNSLAKRLISREFGRLVVIIVIPPCTAMHVILGVVSQVRFVLSVFGGSSPSAWVVVVGATRIPIGVSMIQSSESSRCRGRFDHKPSSSGQRDIEVL